MDKDYINLLEERILVLENMLKNILVDDNKNIIFSHCSIDSVGMGNNCEVKIATCPIGSLENMQQVQIAIENSPIGSLINDDIEDAEDRLDDLIRGIDDIKDAEDRLERLKGELTEFNIRINESLEKVNNTKA